MAIWRQMGGGCFSDLTMRGMAAATRPIGLSGWRMIVWVPLFTSFITIQRECLMGLQARVICVLGGLMLEKSEKFAHRQCFAERLPSFQ